MYLYRPIRPCCYNRDATPQPRLLLFQPKALRLVASAQTPTLESTRRRSLRGGNSEVREARANPGPSLINICARENTFSLRLFHSRVRLTNNIPDISTNNRRWTMAGRRGVPATPCRRFVNNGNTSHTRNGTGKRCGWDWGMRLRSLS